MSKHVRDPERHIWRDDRGVPMRDLTEVMSTVVAVVRESDPALANTLATELHSVLESARYTAPEIMHERWQEACLRVAQTLGRPEGKPWGPTVQRIIRGE